MLLALMLAAQTPACTASVPPPAELTGWSRMSAATAATSSRALGTAPLSVGSAVTATLAPITTVALPLVPAKAAAPGTYGGLFAVTIARPGRYRVALGNGAWIDLVRDGKSQPSVAHRHGPACSDVRKMVDFDLTPGRYVLELSGNATPTLRVMVVAVQK